MKGPFYSILLCLAVFKMPLSRFLTSILAAQHQQQYFPINLARFLLLLLCSTIGISTRALDGYFYPAKCCLQFYLNLLRLIARISFSEFHHRDTILPSWPLKIYYI